MYCLPWRISVGHSFTQSNRGISSTDLSSQLLIFCGYHEAGNGGNDGFSALVESLGLFPITVVNVKSVASKAKVGTRTKRQFQQLREHALFRWGMKMIPSKSMKSMANIAIGERDFSPKHPQLS